MLVYEDKLMKEVLPENPVVKGHVLITADTISLPEDMAHLLSAASFTSTALFESVGAQGSNIIFSDLETPKIDVLARAEGDGVDFRWTPLQLSPQDMDEVAAKIKDKCDYIGQTLQPKKELPKKEEESVSSDVDEPKEEWKDEKSYLLKQLDRMP